MRGVTLFGGFLLAMVLGACQRPAPAPEAPHPEEDPAYVGRATCAECHSDEVSAWNGSNHDLAMDSIASGANKAPFNGESLDYFGETTRFFRENGVPQIETVDESGARAAFPVAHTFGIEPLQQYLVERDKGRMQALPFAWDTRSADEGGQRWFHLYPDEYIGPEDELFWTKPSQNWNHMCAQCHSTDLRKNYDNTTDTFKTSWAEMDVSCEACHGPGSAHVDWAKGAPAGYVAAAGDTLGLTVRLNDHDGGAWRVAPETGRPKRSVPRASREQIETCARCHARRSPLLEDDPHAGSLLDSYLVSFLEPELYFPDGQMRDEVYVYGSFRQSKMYHEGVTCTDCHDAHTTKLKAQGNALCVQCHFPAKYDAPSHHFHAAGTAGAQCVACHMPSRTYMVVDPRRDHSFRIPRPELEAAIGAPSACAVCHDDKDAAWAVEAIASRRTGEPPAPHPFGEAFARSEFGEPGGRAALLAVAMNGSLDGLVRGSALSRLANAYDPATGEPLAQALADADPLVRLGGLANTQSLPQRDLLRLVAPLLEDPIMAVRIEAARQFAAVPKGIMTQSVSDAFDAASAEYVAVQEQHGDRAASQHNLATFRMGNGALGDAAQHYKTAIERDPAFVPSYINLADLYREEGQEAAATKTLEEGVAASPQAAVPHYALGLAYARAGETDKAVEHLKLAAELTPSNPHYRYVYAVALHSSGRVDEAIEALRGIAEAFPFHEETLVALATMERDRGNFDAALRYGQYLVETWPNTPGYTQLLEQLAQLAAGR